MTQIFRGNLQSVRKQISDELDKKGGLADDQVWGGTNQFSTHIRLVGDEAPTGARFSLGWNNTTGYAWLQTFGGKPLALNPLGNNVGIGTTSPSAKLQLPAGTATVAPLKLTSGTNITTPQTGAMEYDGDALYFTAVNVRRAATLANGTIIADTTVANTTTETTAFTEEIAADELHAGQRVRVFVDGIYSTANASDTFTLRVKVGGTTVATLTSTAGNVADAPFSLDFAMTVRSAGATGSAVTRTTGIFDDAVQQAATTGALVLDTTVSEDITVTVQWSAASAGNSLTVQQGHAEFIN